MKLTRFTDYSLRVLIYLGIRPEQRVTIREIAQAYQISRHHLMKVVSNLTRKGYLDAWRGPGGGLALSRPPAEINIAEVVRDMEEDMHLVSCFSEQGGCVIDPVCQLKDLLSQALSVYMDELQKYSLEDLLENSDKLSCILVAPMEEHASPAA
jgi:Rrf2 family nitric oxide-sensitive transcriptional repressor